MAWSPADDAVVTKAGLSVSARECRSRLVAFTAALLLAVLLTAAGVPPGAFTAASRSHATEVEPSAVYTLARRVLEGPVAGADAAPIAAIALPRPMLRTRTIAAGGLPPARAP